jgi:3-hydroxyisobutyrate dehydrogenase
MSETRFGWIGLGNMGWPMARNTKAAGLSLNVFDINQDVLGRFASEFDSGRSSSLQGLGEASDVAITIVPDGKVVRRICFGDGDNLLGGLKPGSILVDMSSSEPTGTRELGAELKAKGITLIDAPVSGGAHGADAGTLSIMVGCDDEEAFKRVEPMFKATGKNVFRCGGLGNGHAMKCLNNYLSAVGLSAANEALIIGKKFGLDAGTMVDIWNVSTGRNASTETKFRQKVLPRTYGSGFAASLMAKDVGIANGLAKSQDLQAPVLEALSGVWNAASEMLPGVDHEVTLEYYERINGVEIPLDTGKKD